MVMLPANSQQEHKNPNDVFRKLGDNNMTFADQQRYIAVQKAKIHTQRQFIHLLENQGEDAEIVQVERDTLGSMVRTLNSASSHLQSLMKKAG